MSSRIINSFFAGAGVGILGGLIGLGGAEFRLPLLIGLFGFPPLPAGFPQRVFTSIRRGMTAQAEKFVADLR